MTKILFYYEYLGLGGVEVILATRLRALMKSDYQVRCHVYARCWRKTAL